tara:strand:- start:1770 stop:1970 length:201 start_codon:yes stop_codon:yes gene_type:complete
MTHPIKWIAAHDNQGRSRLVPRMSAHEKARALRLAGLKAAARRAKKAKAKKSRPCPFAYLLSEASD